MLRVYESIVFDHDFRLVLLAGLICLTAAVTACRVYRRAVETSGSQRAIWLCLCGVSAGAGVWATHFVALLAYRPDLNAGFDPVMTAVSLLAAIVLIGLGFAISFIPRLPHATLIGGGAVGLAVAAMHSIGMTAFSAHGHMTFDPLLSVSALVIGVAFCGASLVASRQHDSMAGRLGAAILFTLAVCGLHFTGMAAMSLAGHAGMEMPPQAISPYYLAGALATVAILLLGGCFATAWVDQRGTRRANERVRELADIAVEGLVVCEGERMIDVNRSFLILLGAEREEVVGRSFVEGVVVPEHRERLAGAGEAHAEVELRTADNARIPVEVICRPFASDGRERRVYAVRDLSERRKAERRIHFLAHHDSLTGLPNRVTFSERLTDTLDRAAREGESVAVLCLDLDRFKEVNDVFGHQSGDAVLAGVAQRLSAAMADGDMVARLGGDEFAVVQFGGPQPERAAALAERLIAAMGREFEFSGQTAVMGTSIGIAIYPSDGEDAATMLANGDTALYRAKSEGRGTFRTFEASMDHKLRERRTLAQELRRAVALNELDVHYQPQAHAQSGEIIGFEALLRWHHPQRGTIPPTVFIPIAEETGLIVQMGEWVLRSVCAEAMTWSKPLRVAVNLSTVQFQHGHLPEMVHQVLLETGLPPSRLELEVTETVLIKDFQRAVSTLRRLKSLGVRIAMDDFGTGYSSLSNLQAFPFDKLKIDRTFVSKLDSQPKAAAIIRAVLGLGRSLSIPVVAEGVETQAQLDFLLAEDCEEVQGYILGRPAMIGTFDLVTGKEEDEDLEACSQAEVA